MTDRGSSPEDGALVDERAAWVAENYPDPALVIGSVGDVLWGNTAAERLFGRTVEEFGGQSVLDLVHPDDVEYVALAMVSIHEKDVGTLIEARVRCHDGWRLLEVRGASMGDHTIISIRDLTDRQRWDVAGSDAARANALLRYGAFLAMQLDRDGSVISSSNALSRLLGHDQEHVDGHPFANLVVAADRDRFAECLRAAVSEPERTTLTRATCEVRLRGFADAEVPYLISLVNLLDDPSVGAIILSGQDIERIVDAETGLRRSHALMSATLEATSEGIVVTDRTGRITHHNQRFLDLWHLPADVGLRADALELMDHLLPKVRDPAGFLARIEQIGRSDELETQDTIELRDGRVIVRTSRPQHVGDQVVGRVFCFLDVSEERRLRQELSHQAFHDSLTGLANVALFRDRLGHALRGLDRDDGDIAVLFVDLDDFKHVNDSLGHAAGDELLSIMATRLSGIVRRHDTVARLGGDEFAILLDHPVTLSEARAVAERAIEVARQPAIVAGTDVSCAASVGVILANRTHDVDEILRNADLAMYAAKAHGKSQHRVFAPEMHDEALRRLELDASLRRALRQGELVVHYQPVWVLPTREIASVEALVRWNHPEHGLLGPAAFIDHAEQTGLIDQIGEYVLAAACRDRATWVGALGADRVPRLGVNLSARQLLQLHLAERIDAILARHDMPPEQLILEVTESALMEDPELAASSLTSLRNLGIHLAVDDFGTGYSSLAYLQRFPIGYLKIDKAFVDDLSDDAEHSLVAAIVQLSQTLHLTPVAEGVETDQQLDALIAMGCSLAQGFLLARPMPADQLLALLREIHSVELRS